MRLEIQKLAGAVRGSLAGCTPPLVARSGAFKYKASNCGLEGLEVGCISDELSEEVQAAEKAADDDADEGARIRQDIADLMQKRTDIQAEAYARLAARQLLHGWRGHCVRARRV